MNAKLKNLLDQKAQLVEQARAALDADKYDEASGLKEQIAELNAKIETVRALHDEEAAALVPDEGVTNNGANADAGRENGVAQALASNEYHRAFFNALSNFETPKTARGKEEYNILLNALTETGGNPAGSEGGFLLPDDFNNRIMELRRERRSLLPYVTEESVITLSGWRAREKNAATATLAPLAEMEDMEEAEAPKFNRIDYKVMDYAGFVPISNDLLDDTPINLMNYLAGWFSRLSVNTENAKILALLKLLSGTAYDVTKGVGPLKTALNKSLDPSISIGAIILTNQSGFDAFDQMEDERKRPLLQTDPTNETLYRIKGREVVMVSDAILPNTANKAPVYVGDLREYLHFFARKPFEMESTRVGGNAWRKNTTEVRGIERFDAQIIDEEAAVKLEIALS